MAITIYADWGNVTMAEYDALAIIRRADAESLLNRFWDQVHRERVIIAGDSDCDGPDRLSDDGRAWLSDLHTRYHETTDENELIAMARDFVKSMGTLLTVNVAEDARS